MVPARFLARERYISIKDRGVAYFEFTPKEVSETDKTRKMLKLHDKKSSMVFSEDFYAILNLKDEVKVAKKTKIQTSNLILKKTEEGINVKLDIIEPVPSIQEITLRTGEFFMLQQFLEYSLPYIMGWYALGNEHLAEQNQTENIEQRGDPFEKI